MLAPILNFFVEQQIPKLLCALKLRAKIYMFLRQRWHHFPNPCIKNFYFISSIHIKNLYISNCQFNLTVITSVKYKVERNEQYLPYIELGRWLCSHFQLETPLNFHKLII